jgi:hypothetical protein
MLTTLLLALSSSLQAASYGYIYDVGDLIDASSSVVSGEIISTESRMESGKIYTNVTLRTSKTWTGSRRSDVSFEVLGGTVDGVTMKVSGLPKFNKGKQVLMFLDDGAIVGFGQGAFSIKNGKAQRDLDNHTDRGPNEFTLSRTLPDEAEARDCLQTKVWDDYDDGWSVRNVSVSNMNKDERMTFPVTLMAGLEYRFYACSDSQGEALSLSILDAQGQLVLDAESDGREVELEMNPRDTKPYYLSISAKEISEDVARAGFSLGIIFR